MRKFIIFIILQLPLIYINAQPTWRQKKDFMEGRYGGIGFSINNKGYAGLGWNPYEKKDIWEYDTTSDQWTYLTDYPGKGSAYVTSFVIGNIAYIGLSSMDINREFYKYDPSTNQWGKLKNFVGGGSLNSCSFVINNTAFIGGGATNNNAFWKYNTSKDIWTEVASIPLPICLVAKSFSVLNKGYVITELGDNSNRLNQVWEYDASSNKWTEKKGFPGGKRSSANGFVLCDKIYYGGGIGIKSAGITGRTLNDYWVYDPKIDVWSQISSLPDSSRSSSSIFTIGNKAYVCGGYNMPKNMPLYLSSLWQFDLGSACNSIQTEELHIPQKPLVYPNPTSDVFTINPEGLNAISVDLFNESGQLIYHHELTTTKSILISDLTDGLYFYKIVTEQGQTIHGKIQKI